MIVVVTTNIRARSRLRWETGMDKSKNTKARVKKAGGIMIARGAASGEAEEI